MEDWADVIIAVVISVTATSGFWSFLQRRLDKKDITRDMLVGLGHDRIVYLGLCYINRGWITQAEYENIMEYLYKPYSKMGGNGSAHKIIQEIQQLPIRTPTMEELKNLHQGGKVIC